MGGKKHRTREVRTDVGSPSPSSISAPNRQPPRLHLQLDLTEMLLWGYHITLLGQVLSLDRSELTRAKRKTES